MSRRSPKDAKSESPEEKPKAERPKLKAKRKAGAGGPKAGEEATSPIDALHSEINVAPSKSPPVGETFENPKSKNSSEIENPTSEITMEVHHHPQLEHKHKPWRAYLLEGLMIFLAVTMGFFAESLREHITDGDKEKQYVQSLTEDLKNDIKTVEKQIQQQKTGIIMLDGLISILDDPANIPAHGNELYYFGRLGPRLRTLAINMRTFEQLKNSGNFRLISKIEISNRIMSYYEKLPQIEQVEDIFTREFVDYKEFASKIFEPAVFRRQENENGEIMMSTDNPPLQKNAPEFIKQFTIYAIYMNGSRRQLLSYNEDLLKSANELLSYLQKQYHLGDE